MKARWIVSTLVLVSLALIASRSSLKKIEIAAPIAAPVAKPEEIDRAFQAVKKAPAANLEAVAKDLENGGDEDVQASFKDYREQQKVYDTSFAAYEKAHEDYQKAIHAAPGGNDSAVEAALAAVDDDAKVLQEETERLNVKAAAFIEEYRRYTFEKFGLALN